MEYKKNKKVLKLEKALKKLNIKYSLIEHEPIKTVEEGLKFLGIKPENGVSTLLLKVDDSFCLVFRRDDHRLDYGKIKKHLKIQNVRVANAKEIEEQLGYKEIGYVSLYNPKFKPLMDESLFEVDYLYGGSGSPNFDLKIKPGDLQKLTKAQKADIAGEKINYNYTVTMNKTIKGKYTILNGFTPSGSGEMHIGNYFGAIAPFFEMAKKADKVYTFIADLHALTTVQDQKELQHNVESLVLSYLSFGIDPKKFIFYRQSDIGLHPELQTILNNITPIGLIKRCHAYKDKLEKGFDPKKVNMGLFNYPILQAADILMYDADYVPVGEDQKQHVEVTREIGQYFNKTYGQTFKIPEVYIRKEAARLVGTDGRRKMSKSLGNVISVFSDEKVIKKQIMGCFTDPKRIHSDDPGRVEGNPIFIYHDLINDNKAEVEDLKKRYKAGKVGDVEVKERLFKALLRKFSQERKRYSQLKNDPEKIKKILEKGAKQARKVAEKKMMLVRDKIGITNKYSFFKY